jgi:DNA-binding NtrC family response regulator
VSYRILIVDDEPGLRRTLERALRGHRYEVVSVADPHSAYQMLDESTFDLVMLDIRLPQMAGDTFFLAIVRRWPRLVGRVILMSGDPLVERPEWAAELAGCPVLLKPFSLDTLIKTVDAVLAAAEPKSDLRKGNGNG